MKEFELIHQLTSEWPQDKNVAVGPGDDCAVLDWESHDIQMLFKTDAVVEGIHFDATDDPQRVGWKALARPLSDIAAMAGTPHAAVVTVGLGDTEISRQIQAVYRGIHHAARQFQTSIVGGETTANPGRLLLSLAVVGSVPRGRAVLRRGSRPGDALFVSGELGGSLDGHHLDFHPRLLQAQWLAAHFPPHAMIDISDGLGGDLRHLLAPDNLGAVIREASIPISRAARRRSREGRTSKSPLHAALTDGEDYELLFTIPPDHAVAILDAWKGRFPEIPLTCIGKIEAKPELRLQGKSGPHRLDSHGYEHFSES